MAAAASAGLWPVSSPARRHLGGQCHRRQDHPDTATGAGSLHRPARPALGNNRREPGQSVAGGLCGPGPGHPPRPLLPAASLLPLPGGPLPRDVRARRVAPSAPPAAEATPHLHPRRGACLARPARSRCGDSRHPCPIRSVTLHTVILLLATSGLRISEALHLTLPDVDLAEGVLSVRRRSSASPGSSRSPPGRWRRCAPTTTCVSQWPPPARPGPSSSPVAAPATAPRPSRRYSMTSLCRRGCGNPTAAVPGSRPASDFRRHPAAALVSRRRARHGQAAVAEYLPRPRLHQRH